MSGRRILIVSTAHLCRNPRVLKEATTLGLAGYDVTVLTLSTSDRFEEADQTLLASRPFRRVALDFRRSQGGWSRWCTRATTWLARQALRRGGIESPATLGPARAVRRAARRLTADLTIAHNEIPLWSVATLQGDGRRAAADLEDWYSEDLLAKDRLARPLRLLRAAEAHALRSATYATTTSDAMATAMAKTYAGRKPEVIRNVFPLQADPFSDRAPRRVPQFVWFSQTIGPGRGLETFLAAWNLMRVPTGVTFIGDVGPAYQARLRELIRPERRDQIVFHPFVAPDALPAKLTEFDLGLALEPSEPRNKELTISNKIFQYLNAGLAIVATETAGQREVMQQAPGCALPVNRQADTFAADLDQLVGDPIRLRDHQRAARAAAEQEFCWEKESVRLLAIIRRALAT